MSKRKKISFCKSGVLSMISDFHIDIDRVSDNISVSVCGTRGVREFSDSQVFLNVSGGGICINGISLTMCVYENSTIEVIGKIQGLEFIYDKA